MSAFDPMAHLRKRRWATAIYVMIETAAVVGGFWLLAVPINEGLVIAISGIAAFFAYRRGADEMHELWMLREAGREAGMIKDAE